MQTVAYKRESRTNRRLPFSLRFSLPDPKLSKLEVVRSNRPESELKRALLDKSIKAKLIGGTLSQTSSQNGSIDCLDRITRVSLDEEGLRIKTYSKLDILITRTELRGSDISLRETDGIIHVSFSFGGRTLIITPNDVQVPPS